MSDVFFPDLKLPRPDINLEVGSGSHPEQTAQVMLSFEPEILQEKPDLVVVVGDVNSTLACSLVADKQTDPAQETARSLRGARQHTRAGHHTHTRHPARPCPGA